MFEYDYTFCDREDCPRRDCMRHQSRMPKGVPVSVARLCEEPSLFVECQYYMEPDRPESVIAKKLRERAMVGRMAVQDRQLMLEAAEVIDRMPTVDAVEVVHGRWIPVTERLPEDGELVLVMANGKPAKEITLHQAYELGWCRSDRDGEWFLEGWPAWSGAKVTHWMAIPEPPKEEK